jgi:hypothetical protein
VVRLKAQIGMTAPAAVHNSPQPRSAAAMAQKFIARAVMVPSFFLTRNNFRRTADCPDPVP